MPEIVLRFVEGGGWDSEIIRYSSRCQWSHVEEYDTLRERTFGAMLVGGVKYRELTDVQYKRAVGSETFKIKLSDNECAKYSGFMQEQDGKPYDWRAIASFAMGQRVWRARDWREDDSWFCSELIARALEVAGVIRFPAGIAASFITPRDLWLLVAGLKS
jgi:hypothetical protein